MQLFTFLELVEPAGGGTLVVAGSHRLQNKGRFIRARELRRLLCRQAFFRDLYCGAPATRDDRQGLPTGVVGDVALEVLELTGAAGDAWMVDLRVLHAGAPNAADRPRMMATHRFVRADVVPEIAEAHGWR